MTTITIHQPDFAPWMGFFDRWKNSDLYIVLDDAQFLRRGWHHRDLIKTPHGTSWLTVPVKKKGRFDQAIKDVLIDDSKPWRLKHLKTIEFSYGKSSGFSRIYPKLVDLYNQGHERLVDFNLALLSLFAAYLKIKTPMVLSSNHPSIKKSTERLIELTMIHGGEVYLTGIGAKDYLRECDFEQKQIKVKWQKFEHPVYAQPHGAFMQGLSVIDYVMNVEEIKEH